MKVLVGLIVTDEENHAEAQRGTPNHLHSQHDDESQKHT